LCERSPRQGSAESIACDGPEHRLDTVAASWTLGNEEDGPRAQPGQRRKSHLDLCGVRRAARRGQAGRQGRACR
jgi:hypothetical protein